MADPELVEILTQGSRVWNRWREQQPEELLLDLSHAQLSNVDLHGINLRHADLSDADLRASNLDSANLRKAILCRADLRRADLSRASLREADLSDTLLNNTFFIDADLRGTNLSRADLSHADLFNADLFQAQLHRTHLGAVNFSRARLHEADVSGAFVWETIFANLDLREVKGLAWLHHLGSSHVALATVQLPQDSSALDFLRGTGVPERWLAFTLSLPREPDPIQYYSCFISYSSKDETLAKRLHADLQEHGVRCWFAPHDMKIGARIRPTLDQAIHTQEKLLLLLSQYSINSAWVEDEVETALEWERREPREMLLPIRLDNAIIETGQAWAATLRRSRHIGDFTSWTDPQAYQQAFARLLRDLKVESIVRGDTDSK